MTSNAEETRPVPEGAGWSHSPRENNQVEERRQDDKMCACSAQRLFFSAHTKGERGGQCCRQAVSELLAEFWNHPSAKVRKQWGKWSSFVCGLSEITNKEGRGTPVRGMVERPTHHKMRLAPQLIKREAEADEHGDPSQGLRTCT